MVIEQYFLLMASRALEEPPIDPADNDGIHCNGEVIIMLIVPQDTH